MQLEARIRKIKGKKVKTLRKKGVIPAIVYGHNLKSRMIEVNYPDFEKIYQKAGMSTLIDLKINQEKPVKVLIHQIQKDSLTDKIQHVDFYQIREKEKIVTEIELKFVGESRAVKELGGILVQTMGKIKVECLPADLVHEIEADLTKLDEIGKMIKIKDLKIPKGIKVLLNKEEIVATVTAPEVEKVEERIEEKIEEKIEKKKEGTK